MNRLARSTNSSLGDSNITLTRALPTTAASAFLPTSTTWALLEIPNPTANGRLVWALTRSKSSKLRSDTRSRAPATPVTLMQYMNPPAPAQAPGRFDARGGRGHPVAED